MFFRKTLAGIDWLRMEKWDEGAHSSYLEFKGNELAGKTIGMVGFGAVGQTIAQLVSAFPCKVLYSDPYYTSDNRSYEKCTIEKVFENSDIVSVQLPVNEQTKGMIDKQLLLKMKREAIFVNTARAAVVNRQDLLETLEQKRIKGAILDVFHHEPPDQLDYKIIHLDNVLATPHIAGATHEVEDHHADIMNRNLFSWFLEDKKYIPQIVNKEILAVINN